MYDSKMTKNQKSYQEDTMGSKKSLNSTILNHSFTNDHQGNQNKIMKNEIVAFTKEKSNSSVKILSLSTIIGDEIERKAQKHKHELKKTQSESQYLYFLKKYSKTGNKPFNNNMFKNRNKKSSSSNDIYQVTNELIKNSIFDVNKYAESHNNEKKTLIRQSYSRILNEHRQSLRSPQPQTNNDNVYNNIYNISTTDKSSSSENEANEENEMIPHNNNSKNNNNNYNSYNYNSYNKTRKEVNEAHQQNEHDLEKRLLLKKFDEHLELADAFDLDTSEKLLKTPPIPATTKKPRKIKKKNKKRLNKSRNSLTSSKESILKEKEDSELLKIKKAIKKLRSKKTIKVTDSLESLDSFNSNSDNVSMKKIQSSSKLKKKSKKKKGKKREKKKQIVN